MRNKPYPVTVREASALFDIPFSTIARWVKRGYITILKESPGRGLPMYLDKLSVESIVDIYRRDPGRGKSTVRFRLSAVDAY
ncbi:MAG TPA: hypothetical protein VMX96_11150 [Dehalococcoidia bacterium]|nr:hypothetical protein [Dehalococcoidia bacterium]